MFLCTSTSIDNQPPRIFSRIQHKTPATTFEQAAVTVSDPFEDQALTDLHIQELEESKDL